MASTQSQERLSVQGTPTGKLHSPKVLVVIDGSERTGRIIEYALSLAQNGQHPEVVLLGVVPQPPEGRLRGYGSFKRDELHARLKGVLGERAIAAAARRLDQAGVSHEDRIEVGDPAESLDGLRSDWRGIAHLHLQISALGTRHSALGGPNRAARLLTLQRDT